MKKTIILVLVTALVTAVVCHFLHKPKVLPREVRLAFDSPDHEFVAVVVTDHLGARDLPLIVQSVHLVRKGEANQNPTVKPGADLGFRGNSIATIHSCENGDIDVRWTSERALLIRYSQTTPDWISMVKTADGVAVSIEEKPKAPSQPSQPMPLTQHG